LLLAWNVCSVYHKGQAPVECLGGGWPMRIGCVHIPRFAVEVERQRRDGTTNVIAEEIGTLAVRSALAAPRSHNFA
jgi:hypothetical protein